MRKLRQEVDVSIKEITHNVDEIKKELITLKGMALVKALKKNLFEAYYVGTKGEAVKLLHSLIPDGSIIGVGDSHSFYQLDMEDELRKRDCKLITNKTALNLHGYNNDQNPYVKELTREQVRDILADYLTSDVFVLSANAITMEGEIINVDGLGNRIAGSLFGADRIIMVVGINKVVSNEASARERVATVASPMNKIKYGDVCPSVKTGVCTHCSTTNRSCNITTIIHKRPLKSDYHIIIVGEELGF